MRLKTKLVLAITAMIVALVTTFSFIYVSQLMRQRISIAFDTANLLSHELQEAASDAQPDLSSTRVDTTNPEEYRTAVAESLQTDVNLNTFLDSVVGDAPIIYDAAITDQAGHAILHTNPEWVGKVMPERPDFRSVLDAGFFQQLRAIFSAPRVYEVRQPLELNNAPFGSTRVSVSTVFLKNAIQPHLTRALVVSGTSILLSLVLAAALSNFALAPLMRISQRLDSVSAGEVDVPPAEAQPQDEYGLVTLKIAHLGRQIRDAREVFSALKDNLDQIMANLQDGLILFTREARIVLVSASAEDFAGRPRAEMLGRGVAEVFSPDDGLGRVVLEAFKNHQSISNAEVERAGRNVQISLDFIREGSEAIGALLVMRDVESVRRIEDEIELSRRLSAIGRLTSGVAHEVKNPINAIVVHLEVLRNKLRELDPDTSRHLDVIGSEIRRLDRVVQLLVDFTRPVELRLAQADLRKIVEDVAVLVGPEAAIHGVTVQRTLAAETLPVNVDVDMVKHALLNVVKNGIQAMPKGGLLTLVATHRNGSACVEVSDQGMGIPAAVQAKIFDLYFTTKPAGSGIGLPMAYRIMQLHQGSIDFESAENTGTVFRLQFPLAVPLPPEKEAAEVRTS
jgi:PAS domain S-box-containing protein